MDFEHLLTACLSVDNQTRRQAEEVVKQLSGRPDILPQLVQAAAHAADPQVRHLAAVLLRKRVDRHWGALSPQVRSDIQKVLLQQLASEPHHAVRVALAHVVGSVGRHAVPQQQWPDLLTLLYQYSSSSSAEHKEVAMLLFASLMDDAAKALTPHLSSILAAAAGGIADPSRSVSLAALKVVEPCLGHITQDHVPGFHQLLQAIMTAGERALSSSDEDLLQACCQALVEVAESPAPLLAPVLPAMLQMVATVANNRQLSDETREGALELVHWLARYKPKQLQKQKVLVQQIILLLCHICCEGIPEGHDGASGTAASQVAAQTLDVLALNLSSGLVLPPVLEFVGSASSSTAPSQRGAALIALSVVAEGCADPLRRQLPGLLEPVLAGLGDPHQEVRGKAAFALGQFSEYLQPDIIRYHARVLPVVLGLLADPAGDVLERACYAIDAFTENLEPEEVLPYLGPLMSGLLTMTAVPSRGVQEMAVSALASVIAAAHKAFLPYLEATLPVLQHFLAETSAESRSCRCKATEAAGILVHELGPDEPLLAPHVPSMLDAILRGFDPALDSEELREFGHMALTHLARALGDRFGPYLQQAVQLALQSCQLDDGMAAAQDLWEAAGSREEGEEAGQQQQAAAEGEEDGSDSDDSDNHFNVRTAVLDEKAAATSALGAYAAACPALFAPYTEPVLEQLKQMADYWHEFARISAYNSLSQLLLSTSTAFPGSTSSSSTTAAAAAGSGAPSSSSTSNTSSGSVGPLSPQAAAVAGVVVPLLLEAVAQDPDKEAVTEAASGLVEVLRALKAAPFSQEQLGSLSEAAAMILRGKAPCQEGGSDDDDEGEGEDEGDEGQIEEDLVSAAADLLPALAGAMGWDAYAPLLCSTHGPALLWRLRPAEVLGIRALASGALAEVAEVLGGRVAPLVAKALPAVLRELKAPDAINRQNAAFCCGMLVEGCPQQCSGQVEALLTSLHPLFGEEEEPGTRDNAAGAVSRLLLAYGGALPLEQILPVLLKVLPPQEDLAEAEVVVRALCGLMTGEVAQRVSSLAPQMVQALGGIAVLEAAPQAARVQAAQTLSQLAATYPQHMGPLLTALPADQQAVLRALAGSS